MILLLIALAPAPAAAAPLDPNGPWTVAFEESMCLVSRKFGQGSEVELLLRPSPLGDDVEVTFVDRAQTVRKVMFDKDATLTVAPVGTTVEVTYRAWYSPSQKGRVTIAYTEQPLMSALTDGAVLTFSAQGEKTTAVSMSNLQKLKPVIEDCKKTVAKHWGVDLSAIRNVQSAAKPLNPRKPLVNITDYPDAALRQGKSGIVTLLWTIGTDGLVSDCRILSSSGEASLDQAGCKAIRVRAKYEPARDATGKPTVDYGMRRIYWMPPR